MAPENSSRQYPLYNTTFSLHRLTPLFTGGNLLLNNATLQQLALRFRDILAGEVLRGVRVGLAPEDGVLARAGGLQIVTWKLLPEEEAWVADDETELGIDETKMSLAASRGILVTVTYEKMAYRAILLRDLRNQGLDETMAGTEESKDGFQHFPLMLAKMPGALRETFTDFLTQTFDTRVSALHLSSSYLTNAFERYLADISISDDGSLMDVVDTGRSLRSIIKDTAVFIGFDLLGGSTALKTVDIQIAREDLPRMVSRGKKIDGKDESPFLNALTGYVKAHLALDLRHERVKIVRIACGAFVLGGDGRVKLTPPSGLDDGDNPQSRATRRLVNDLVRIAAGGALSGNNGEG
jgi:hypothetical protein